MRPGELWRRIRSALSRQRMAQDLEEEMRLHLELRAQRLRETGISGEEAESVARRKFGNRTLLKETSRETWSFVPLETVWRELRLAARTLCHIAQIQGAKEQDTVLTYVTPEYFRALRTPILRGRAFKTGDNMRAQRVGIVNNLFAKKFFGTVDPVGRYIKQGPTLLQVVGMISDVPVKASPARIRAGGGDSSRLCSRRTDFR